MHQRSRHNLPTTEQPSGQRSAHKDELSLPVTAKRMQTAAMRTRSQVKTGNNNNSKVLDSNPHSGPMLRLRANRADNNYNTASRAENVRRQGRPLTTPIRREVTNDHLGGINLFNNYNITSQFHSTGCIPSITSSINNCSISNNNNVGINSQEIGGSSEVSRLDITARSFQQPQQQQQQQLLLQPVQSSPQRPSRSTTGVIATSTSDQQRIHSPFTNMGSPLLAYPSIYPHPSSSPPNPPSCTNVVGYMSTYPAPSQSQSPPRHRASSPIVSTGTLGTQVEVRTSTGVRTGTGSTGTVGTQGGVRTGTQSQEAYLGAVRTGTVGTQGGVRTSTESLAETTFRHFHNHLHNQHHDHHLLLSLLTMRLITLLCNDCLHFRRLLDCSTVISCFSLVLSLPAR